MRLRDRAEIRLFFFLIFIAASCYAQVSAAGSSSATVNRFAALDQILEKAVQQQNPPGVVVLVWHNGETVYRKAFGYRSLEPQREPMTMDTIFDMASLTKCMVTATGIMQLVQSGQVRLNDPVAKYIPEFTQNGKQDITVRQLLIHYSGLPDDLDLKSKWEGYDTAIRMAMESTPVFPPGSRFFYSDVNYIVLGELIHRVTGQPLDEYAAKNIFEPLGMSWTRFNPPAYWRERIESTEYDEHGVMLRGVVHDPTARRMGGVAGHAGLFSSADDTAKFAKAMLAGGAPILSALSVEKMTTPQQPPNDVAVRGIGWDIDSPLSSNRGEFLPVGSYGHTGFTGTSLWIDPTTDTYIIILANGVHPRGGSVVSLRSRVATAVAAALDLTPSEQDKLRMKQITGYSELATAARRIAVRNGTVRTGIDVLEDDKFAQLKGKHRIGLLTNQTGIDSQGRRTIDVLAHVPGVQLTAIFSPEHGIVGTLDQLNVGNTKDAATSIPVYSVYGGTDAKRRPPADIVKSLDAIVFDIQDVGVRYWTYETTLGYFLEAAAANNVELIVLDRPNPITGAYVQGPLLDPGMESFTGYYPLPVRHGMTIGELAKLFNSERHINARLTVIPMRGWYRGDWFDSTGLLWVDGSPNMRSLNEATLYPGIGLIEGTNISVGRGTDTPFEVVGAPWINAQQFASYLNNRGIAGVRFVPVIFTPNSSEYPNQLCGGVNIFVLDRNVVDAPELGMEVAAALRQLYPQKWQMNKMLELYGNKASFDRLAAGEDPRRVNADLLDGIQAFEQVRKQYLMY
ncbi:MAG TPA: serine hydrolase [Terriglobales bacterium]|nr:serine hydrolase [Terriglobales bacterium]